MINRVILVGRLVADVELRYTQNNIANTKFRLAVNRSYKKEGQPDADFINCVAWRAQAENMARFLKKGSLIGVEGRIETGSFQGQDGQMRYTTDVIVDSVQFLEPRTAEPTGDKIYDGNSDNFKGGWSPGGGGHPNPYETQDANGMFGFNSTLDISDTDLPF